MNDQFHEIARNNREIIILSLLKNSPKHGYQLIGLLRKKYHAYLGPSTVYPLLDHLKKSGYIQSCWNMSAARPRKVYNLTFKGEQYLGLLQSQYRVFVTDFVWGDRVTVEVRK